MIFDLSLRSKTHTYTLEQKINNKIFSDVFVNSVSGLVKIMRLNQLARRCIQLVEKYTREMFWTAKKKNRPSNIQ